MKKAILILLLCSACGDVASTDSSVVNTQNSPVDNSEGNVLGNTNCTTTCTPVDSVNCNNEGSEVSATNNQCFLVVRQCEGPQQPDGPDLTTVPPIECIQDGDNPTVFPTTTQ